MDICYVWLINLLFAEIFLVGAFQWFSDNLNLFNLTYFITCGQMAFLHRSLLCGAVEQKDHETLGRLLTRIGANKAKAVKLASTNYAGDLPTHIACKANSPKCLSLLLQHQAPVNLRNAERKTPLECAARSGALECVRAILCAVPSVSHGSRIRAFALSVVHKKWEAAKLILLNSSTSDDNELLLRGQYIPLLHLCCAVRDVSFLRVVLLLGGFQKQYRNRWS